VVVFGHEAAVAGDDTVIQHLPAKTFTGCF
jgi:hypothetical protein